MGSLSRLQGIFPTQGSNQGLHIAGRFFTIWATEGKAQKGKRRCVSSLGFSVLGYEQDTELEHVNGYSAS